MVSILMIERIGNFNMKIFLAIVIASILLTACSSAPVKTTVYNDRYFNKLSKEKAKEKYQIDLLNCKVTVITIMRKTPRQSIPISEKSIGGALLSGMRAADADMSYERDRNFLILACMKSKGWRKK